MLFISYGRDDRKIATEVYERLTEKGYSLPFLDYHPEAGIFGGKNWEDELRWQVKVARGLVVVYSENWDQSRWTLVELQFAKEFGATIIPLNTTNDELPSLIADYQGIRHPGIPFQVRNDEVYSCLFDALREHQLKPEDDFRWPRGECPYPGLSAFQEEHAGVYFGRDAELNEFFDKHLEPMARGDNRMVYVFGPSGSGKSSFVRAGVVPRLRYKSNGRWRVLSVFRWADLKRDSHQWNERFARDVQRAYGGHPQRPNWRTNDLIARYAVTEQQTAHQAARQFVLDVKEWLDAIAVNELPIPLLVLDQFEEILNAEDVEQSQRFLEFLQQILGDDSPCRCIATVRSDFLSSIQSHPQLIQWNDRTNSYLLDLLRDEKLHEVIEGPANVVGADIDAALVSRLVSEAESADALPLLSFTLRKFYGEFAKDGKLTLEEYERRFGGLEQCLEEVANSVFEREPPEDEQMALRTSFIKKLVSYRDDSSDKAPYTRKKAVWKDIPKQARSLLNVMNSEDFRLVRIDADGKSGDKPKTVEVTHEALFRTWKKLKGWLDECRDVLQWRSDVRRDRERFEAEQRRQQEFARDAEGSGRTKTGWLHIVAKALRFRKAKWPGLTRAQLEKARPWLKSRRDDLEEDEISWIRGALRKRRCRLATLTFTCLCFLALANYSYVQNGLYWKALEQASRAVDDAEKFKPESAVRDELTALERVSRNLTPKWLKDTSALLTEARIDRGIADILTPSRTVVPGSQLLRKLVTKTSVSGRGKAGARVRPLVRERVHEPRESLFAMGR